MVEISDQTVKEIFDIVAEARIIEALAQEICEREASQKVDGAWQAVDERRAELCHRVAEIPFRLV